MKVFFKSISVFFHPLIMPLIGVLFYFSKSPRYIPQHIIYAKVISIIILTIALPILLFFLLKTIRKVNSIYLETSSERLLPLLIHGIIILLILRKIFTQDDIIELYYFFLGILVTTLSCLFLAILKFKASIHMAAITGVFMFFVALSIHFSININGTLAMLCVLIGAIASSRLFLNAHNYKELIIGAFLGLLPQLILLTHWL